MDITSPLKSAPDVLPELAAFLTPFLPLLQYAQSRQSLERYLTGLLSDLPRKNARQVKKSVIQQQKAK